MNRVTPMLLLLMACGWGGCAAHRASSSSPPVAEDQSGSSSSSVAAAALVFSPPVTAGEPELALSRQGRATEAFVGFDQLTTSYHYVRFDDRQSDDFRDGYLRHSVTVQTGVSRR